MWPARNSGCGLSGLSCLRGLRTTGLDMRKLFLASAVLLAMPATAATAADLRTKAPVLKAPPPVAVFSWSGFYVGANIGYSWGRARNDWDVFVPALTVVDQTVCPPALCASGSDSNKLNGAIGGLQAGYNWQMANVLVGLEADIQASGQKGSEVFSAPFATSIIIGVTPGGRNRIRRLHAKARLGRHPA